MDSAGPWPINGLVERPRSRGFFESLTPSLLPYLLPILLLISSNVFKTAAWYWHLRYQAVPLHHVTLFSWGAGADRILPSGAGQSLRLRGLFGAAQDHAGVITLAVFASFSYVYLREPLTWNQGIGFSLIALGAFFVFHKW